MPDFVLAGAISVIKVLMAVLPIAAFLYVWNNYVAEAKKRNVPVGTLQPINGRKFLLVVISVALCMLVVAALAFWLLPRE